MDQNILSIMIQMHKAIDIFQLHLPNISVNTNSNQ